MRFTIFTILAAASAGLAAAQSTAAAVPTGGACQAQNIVDACKDTIQSTIDACEANDWMCLCDTYTNLLTCYNNCPNSLDRPPVENTVTSYCNAAAPIKSASLAAAATQPKPSSQAPTATATSTDSASASTTVPLSLNTGAANALALPGSLAVVAGLAALL